MKLRRSVALLVLLAASGCDLLLGGSYTVSDLDEYEDHIAGADLNSKHQVGLLQFPCETLREAWVARAQAQFDRFAEEENIYTWMDFENEGPVLTLHRSSATRVITTVEFNDWTEQFSQAFMESADGASGDRSLDSMVRLFDTIQLRASNTSEDFAEDFDVTYRYACGRNRSPES